MKRNLIIILVVLIAAVAGFIYLSNDDVVFSKETSLYKAVPISSPVFVELSSLNAIPKENSILQELNGIEEISWLLGKINETDLAIKGNSAIQNQLSKKPLIIALDFIGENVLKPVLITEIRTAEDLKGFEVLLEKLLDVPAASFKARKYDGNRIVDVVDGVGKNLMHYCAVDGIIILSPEAILVEKSVRQLTSQNITDISYFKKVNKTVTSQSDIAWYINHNRFPDLWANYLNDKTKSEVNEFGETVKTNLKRAVQGIQNYASWSELDLTFDEEKISLNGITAADDSLNNFLSVFEGQAPVSCNADRLLPKNTSFFIAFTFSERELFFKKLEKYFELSSSYFTRESNIKKIEKQFRVDSRNTLQSLVKNQVVAAITSVPSQTDNKSTLFIVNNDTKQDTKALFEGMLTNYARIKKVEFNTLYAPFKAADGIAYRIYSFPFPSLPGIWLGKSFGFAKANYAVFYDDNLIFGSSKETLQNYLGDMISESTLYRSKGYGNFKQSTESRANINTYLNVNRIYALNTALFNKEFSNAFEVNEEIICKFDAIGWQVVCEKNIYFNTINLVYNTTSEVDARALWQSDIGSEISMKPQIVENYSEKKSREVIVQDNKNKLHLIDAGGNILWSAPVKGKILSKIHQIDYYRNGRLQYLFNTAEKLYLLDRTGKMLKNFPKIFESHATNGVNVFDYDNNRKYRYFVACANKKVYAYNHEGRIIAGWKFGRTSSIVTKPVQHFRVNNKDYIVFKDESEVYIQNRQGQTRVSCAAKFENSNNPLVLNTNGTPKIVATDKTGNVFYLYFNGKYVEKETEKLSKNHFFTVADINGNGIPDFVFVDGKELIVMDENGKKLFSKKFDSVLKHRANLYSFSGKQMKIGVTDANDDKIYLFDATGKLHQGFPLEGNSEFSIDKLTESQLNLVVGSSDEEIYNYILD